MTYFEGCYHIKRRGDKICLKRKKSTNKSHSRKRIVVEHTICRMKKHRILADVFRNRLRNYDKVYDIVSGLVNYRTLASSF